MDRLSSCYFCGGALDATLEEYPVVPAAFRQETEAQKTVVLCGTCRRKLDAMLDEIVESVEAHSDTSADDETDAETTFGDETGFEPAVGSDDDEEDSSGTMFGEDEEADSGTMFGEDQETDIETTLGDDEDILRPLGMEDDEDDDHDVEAAAEASAMEFGDDRASSDDEEPADSEDSTDDSEKERKYSDSRGAGFRRDDEPTETGSLTGGKFSDDSDDESAESESLTGGAFSDSGSDDAPGRTTGNGRDGSGSSESTAGGADGSESASGAGGSGSTGGTGGGQSASGRDDTEMPDVSMSRLENTKVMRLLENREFPVDREEFVVVAANAYQISRDDCDNVLDLAIEHGLIREEEGQILGGDR